MDRSVDWGGTALWTSVQLLRLVWGVQLDVLRWTGWTGSTVYTLVDGVDWVRGGQGGRVNRASHGGQCGRVKGCDRVFLSGHGGQIS
ncbi:hypothetical protein B0H11DRAFT_1996790 [Mycena galericulata]|nr:hypothetical protein B0H11DRAFT_1996790 [Mycena galericulata]